MIYRNIKTGAEIITNSVISAPNWEQIKAVAPKEAPIVEPPKEEPPKAEKVKSAPKKTAPKKRGTKK